MVRSIVGTLVDVGLGRQARGRASPAILRPATARAAGRWRPPHGLCLWEVGYPDAGLPGWACLRRPTCIEVSLGRLSLAVGRLALDPGVVRLRGPRGPTSPCKEEVRFVRTYTPKASEITARLARHRRRRPGARPAVAPRSPAPARQAQADLRPAPRHRRPRDRRQRRQGRAHVGQGRREERLPPLRLPGRPQRETLRATCSPASPRRPCAGRCGACCPKGPLGRQMLQKLKVYAGPTHPHAAQQPQPLELAARPARASDDVRGGHSCPSPSSRPPAAARRPSPASACAPAPGKIIVNGRAVRATTSRSARTG